LALSLEAGVSARHLSFIESGRSTPSREMVLLLADSLEVPIRERNVWLTAAGYAELYGGHRLDEPALAPARRAIDLILRHQLPFPAIVMDRHWNIVEGNAAAQKLFGTLLEGRVLPGPPNVVRTMFHPEGVRRWVTNWETVAGALVRRVYRESIGGMPDAATGKLLDEVIGYAGVPRRMLLALAAQPDAAILPISFRHGGCAFDYFSTITTLGTPRDATLQEIRIECFFPVNDSTAELAADFLRTPGLPKGT
jgi:transcriptional regulator with XRE-family HTH domain